MAEVRPAKGKHPIDGEVVISDVQKAWKHHIPFAPLPSAISARPVCTLICVREIRSWLCALSEHAYTIKKKQGGRRKKYNVEWMLREEITIQDEVSTEVYGFSHVPGLYSAYLVGYFAGHLSINGGPVLVVRYEDLLLDPKCVLQQLAECGLKRKSGAHFAAIEENTGSSGRDRSALIEQEQAVDDRFSHDQLLCIGGGLSQECIGHLHTLGYA